MKWKVWLHVVPNSISVVLVANVDNPSTVNGYIYSQPFKSVTILIDLRMGTFPGLKSG